jgi:hypothetical protein
METQESEKISTRSVGIRYGLMLAVISIAFFVIMNVAGIDMQGPVSYLSWVFSGVILFLAHKYFKENGDGYMTIGQGVGIGFWAGLLSSITSSIFTYVYIKFIDTGFMDAIKDKQIESMQERGMSEAEIDQAMKFASAFSTPEAIMIFGIVFGIIGAIVISLLISIFTKNVNPETEI